MNLSNDQQENYWQKTDQQPSLDDYPQESYQPTETESPAEPDTAPAQKADIPDDSPISWVANEYVFEEKGPGWYAGFAVVALALIAADIFLLQSWLWSFSILVVVMSISLLVYSRRPPRQVQYALSGKQGLYIGERLYHLADFKAFGLIKDGEHYSIMLIPIKRFAPGVSVYFPEEVGERIVDILGQRLPMETLKLDAIDVLIRKLHL